MFPQRVAHRAAHQHVQELAHAESEQHLIFDVQMRRNLVVQVHVRLHGLGKAGSAFCTSVAMVCASSTMARPAIAAKAASLALSIRRGLPPAVMYRKPAQARNTAAAPRPTCEAMLSRWSNKMMIGCGSFIVAPIGQD